MGCRSSRCSNGPVKRRGRVREARRGSAARVALAECRPPVSTPACFASAKCSHAAGLSAQPAQHATACHITACSAHAHLLCRRQSKSRSRSGPPRRSGQPTCTREGGRPYGHLQGRRRLTRHVARQGIHHWQQGSAETCAHACQERCSSARRAAAIPTALPALPPPAPAGTPPARARAPARPRPRPPPPPPPPPAPPLQRGPPPPPPPPPPPRASACPAAAPPSSHAPVVPVKGQRAAEPAAEARQRRQVVWPATEAQQRGGAAFVVVQRLPARDLGEGAGGKAGVGRAGRAGSEARARSTHATKPLAAAPPSADLPHAKHPQQACCQPAATRPSPATLPPRPAHPPTHLPPGQLVHRVVVEYNSLHVLLTDIITLALPPQGCRRRGASRGSKAQSCGCCAEGRCRRARRAGGHDRRGRACECASNAGVRVSSV